MTYGHPGASANEHRAATENSSGQHFTTVLNNARVSQAAAGVCVLIAIMCMCCILWINFSPRCAFGKIFQLDRIGFRKGRDAEKVEINQDTLDTLWEVNVADLAPYMRTWWSD